MKVYVVIDEDVNIDFCNCCVKVFAKKELAQKYVETKLKDIQDNFHSWEDMSFELYENGNGFEMYEDGYYNNNHIKIIIEEKDVIENE